MAVVKFAMVLIYKTLRPSIPLSTVQALTVLRQVQRELTHESSLERFALQYRGPFQRWNAGNCVLRSLLSNRILPLGYQDTNNNLSYFDQDFRTLVAHSEVLRNDQCKMYQILVHQLFPKTELPRLSMDEVYSVKKELEPIFKGKDHDFLCQLKSTVSAAREAGLSHRSRTKAEQCAVDYISRKTVDVISVNSEEDCFPTLLCTFSCWPYDELEVLKKLEAAVDLVAPLEQTEGS